MTEISRNVGEIDRFGDTPEDRKKLTENPQAYLKDKVTEKWVARKDDHHNKKNHNKKKKKSGFV